jgi:glycosyltransferase involved in cell wall biosynthesis
VRIAQPSAPRRVCLVGLIAGGHSGVPRYAARLARALDETSAEYPQLSLSLLTTAAGAEAADPRRIEVRVAGRGRYVNAGPGRLLLEHVAVRRMKADLLHYFDVTGPLLAPGRPFVATVHDAAFLHGFARSRDSYNKRLYPWALRRATALVAVSQFAKDEAVRHFSTDPGKIEVVHSGPGLFFELEPSASPADRDGTLLVYVGNLGGNKNLPFLVRAFERADVPARLVLAGRARGSLSELERAIADARSDRVQLRLDVSDAEIIRLYRTALALLLPSTYEGFGFTSLEAMACGCPVLESDIPALREVSGSGAMLLSPDDEEAWTGALRRIVADGNLRRDLSRRGAETVARYSWRKTARGVLDVLAGVAVRS